MHKQVDAWAEGQLQRLRSRGQLRNLTTYGDSTPEAPGLYLDHDGRQLLNFSSNDYLALSVHPEVVAAMVRASAVGTAASRLVSGNRDSHQALEEELANYCGYASALLYGSGYLANLGVLSALVGRHDVVFADRLIHASLLDGIRLSQARQQRFRHNDLSHLRDLLQKEQRGRRGTQRFFLVTESLFSMTGDLAPLKELAELAREFEAILILDEAHALGVFGPAGRGRIAEAELSGQVYVCTVSFAKAFGCYGGAALCSSEGHDYLVNQSRQLLYNTSLPCALVEASRASLAVLLQRQTLGAQLLEQAEGFRSRLSSIGCEVASESQIISLVVGENERALRLAKRLNQRGVLAVAIRPPTVPEGQSCVRLSVTLHHPQETLTRVAELVEAEVGALR